MSERINTWRASQPCAFARPTAYAGRTAAAERSAFRLRASVAVVLWAAVIGILALSGCRAPDKAILAADAQFYDSIGQEYSANLEAGRIWPLRKSTLGGTTLSAEIMDADTIERRRAAMRAWKALRDKATGS